MGPFDTERLVLRKFQIADVNDIYSEVYSDPDVCRYYCGDVDSLENTRAKVQRLASGHSDDGLGRLAVELRSSQKVIGQVHLDRFENTFYQIPGEELGSPYYEEVELAFAFGKAHWGKGLAYEASIPMLDYAFNQIELPRLVGGAYPENERSMKLQKRLGYQVFENSHACGGGWVTVLQNPYGSRDC